MEILHLTKDNFDETINGGKTVMVDFWASWCGPCRMLAPILEEVAGEMTDENIVIAKVDVDKEQELAERFQVMTIPTVLVFRKGKAQEKSVGLVDKEKLMSMIK